MRQDGAQYSSWVVDHNSQMFQATFSHLHSDFCLNVLSGGNGHVSPTLLRELGVVLQEDVDLLRSDVRTAAQIVEISQRRTAVIVEDKPDRRVSVLDILTNVIGPTRRIESRTRQDRSLRLRAHRWSAALARNTRGDAAPIPRDEVVSALEDLVCTHHVLSGLFSTGEYLLGFCVERYQQHSEDVELPSLLESLQGTAERILPLIELSQTLIQSIENIPQW
ncbi:hypothetical protein IL38_14695 [Actinopolyspora erythraea]|uniref:GPP34 family phosphoprotein n=1 Tax=Actinopolyspora erythraea TaxID=414996 RepID=A0ABR4X2X3_9ACTN|nr:hypothetical protein IL38_14695 [Actinopolyspora erythraea]